MFHIDFRDFCYVNIFLSFAHVLFHRNDMIGSFRKRVPEMYVSLLCKGMILGESDIIAGKTKYTSTFTTVKDSSVYEMPMKTYKYCIKAYHKNRATKIKVPFMSIYTFF